mmetsp:Transcript_14466/g.27210  ORF Transcript_14466/g.27210 Transcript_14466/m.27210 type:complete len:715 (+) Transcript_14466:2394-4538(+)|eukprot:CAMPEP_0176496202 /NCGR_PEP_ID=MMETSP0200_2-20121128/11071_1 /TAXON_ID=947934 /ORGANISM="Chaetoceros sp., Strain GSL56" /LENGTH=714 /DNA_ID=CAMNT_0017894145 /DNA_START=2128 /DNA_END=4272 /DNA_ORIENTATION=-
MAIRLIYTLAFLIGAGSSSASTSSGTTTRTTTTTSTAASRNMDQWYQKYPLYPDYCSTPAQMKQRAIPPLTKPPQQQQAGGHEAGDDSGASDTGAASSRSIETSLLHVTAIIRHGSRTPYDNHSCWKGWETQSWNCDLKTMTAPPTVEQIMFLQKQQQQQQGVEGVVEIDSSGSTTTTTIATDTAMFLFEKNYNALQNPPQLANFLNGTCQKGQLLLRGYVQELENGIMLRKTYMKEVIGQGKDQEEMDKNKSDDGYDDLVLFDLNLYNTNSSSSSISSSSNSSSSAGSANDNGNDDNPRTNKRPYEEPNLYYRSDDDQRTIMSGQILLRGLFGDLIQEHSDQLGPQRDPIIKVHTADRERDVLSPNPTICPKLNDLMDEAVKSREYIEQYVKSQESQEMNRIMERLGGGNFREQAQDCLMTTICNDRDLPSILDDYGRDDENDSGNDSHNQYFDRLNKYSFQPYNYVLRYNNAAYSKLAFGPMWVEILANMLPFIPFFKWQVILPQMVKEVKEPSNAPLLSLFSAHDTTILPILATLGENVWDGQTWAPYASLIVVEVHKVGHGDDRAFRLIYNGEVLTDKVDGCLKGMELCDVMYLFNQLRDVAVKDRDCTSSTSSLSEDAINLRKVLFTKKGGAILVFLTILSGIMGGILTFVYLTRRLPYRGKDGKGVFNKAPSTLPMDDIEVTHPYGYGAADSSRIGSKELVLEENIIL